MVGLEVVVVSGDREPEEIAFATYKYARAKLNDVNPER